MDKDIARLLVHERYSDLDIVDWMIGIVRPQESESILDLGCGTGRQLLRFVQKTGPSAKAIGIDLSKEGIADLRLEVEKRGLKVEARLGRIEGFEQGLARNQCFDIGMSNFALYYVKTLGKTVGEVAKRLTPKGRFFVSGPACHNNFELIQFHSQAVGVDPEGLLPHEIEDRVLPAMKKTFPRVEQFLFRNPVRFPSAQSLIDYWKGYYLYTPSREKEFAQLVSKHFKSNKEFVTVKEVLGVIGYVS